MNPYVLLAVVLAWGGSVGGAFFYGESVGRDGEIAGQAQIAKAVEDTRAAAQLGAADAIAQIKVTNTTVRGKTETIVRENVVYRDCRHSPEAVIGVNRALAGTSPP